MTEMIQVRLVGLGGQGIVLAGLLLGQAGAIEGKYVAGSNSYGAQARGSGCEAGIVFSNRPIDFPHLVGTDILAAMSQGTYQTYCKDIKDQGIIFYDTGLVAPDPAQRVTQKGVAATEVSVNKLKNKQAANIVLLGAIVETTKIVSPKALEKAIALHAGGTFRALNLRALRTGIELGKRSNV